MRIPVLIGSIIVSSAAGIATAPAGSEHCCAGASPPPFPKVLRALPETPFVVPPTGYVLDPADARLPFYVLNGPYGIGFAAPSYARPTYSEGGYAFAGAYPYDLPYVSYGAFSAPPGAAADPLARPFGAPPYTAYRYRPAPNARIIHLNGDGEGD